MVGMVYLVEKTGQAWADYGALKDLPLVRKK